jgi:hypothetical protein
VPLLTPLLAAVSLLLFGAPAGSAPAGAAEPKRDAVLAHVDGDSVTTRDLVELLASLPRPRPGSPDAGRTDPDKLLKRLIQNRLLEQEGYRSGAQEDPMVKNQVWELTRHRAMLALLDSVTADIQEPEEGDFDAAFDRTNLMHRVSHILVDNEPLALALLDSLNSGASFEALSRRHSLDSTRAESGGDLGWARADLYVPEFQRALEGVPVGALAGPVASDQGWHILRLTETRTETVGQSDAMREELREAAMRKRVMQRVRGYVASVKEKYGVTTADSLVASLDYGSTDPAVATRLRESGEVVAILPWRQLTVGELTRRIRFEHFHGVEGKPEAAQIRDRMFDEWVTELILRHEAAALGFDRKPAIVDAADRLERQALREIVIKVILDRPFDPGPEQVQRFHEEHAADLTPAPRFRAVAAHLADEESAREFRRQVESGADVGWLAERAAGVVDPSPAAYAGWVSAEALGLAADELREGALLGPVPVDGAWAVLKIRAVEPVGPIPLDQCRDRVLAMMKNERSEEVMRDAIGRLEAQTEIRIEEGAREVVAMWIDDWAGASTTPASQ